MTTETQQPFYQKATIILFGIILFIYVLHMLGDILVPLAFSGLFAVLLNPLYLRFLKWKIPNVVAILLTLLIAIVVLGAIFYFLSSQIIQFGEMLPAMKEKFNLILTDVEQWITKTFGIGLEKQVQYLNEAASSNKALLGQTLSGALGMFSLIFLVPVYIFLLLFYKTLILNFIYEVFSQESSESVAGILQGTKTAIQSYIVGLLIETLIIAVLNSAALLIIGVEYAILLGVLGAILNLIPYIGGIVAILLPVVMATITTDGYSTQLAIIGAYAVIQFLDNNIIVPRVVSSQVQVNALVSIIAVLLGGALWGVSGMFLSIPFVAVLKIIFDRIDGLKPWGKLLGDEVPTRLITMDWGRKGISKRVRE